MWLGNSDYSSNWILDVPGWSRKRKILGPLGAPSHCLWQGWHSRSSEPVTEVKFKPPFHSFKAGKWKFPGPVVYPLGIPSNTAWWKNPTFFGDVIIKTFICRGFPTAIFDYQRVHVFSVIISQHGNCCHVWWRGVAYPNTNIQVI